MTFSPSSRPITVLFTPYSRERLPLIRSLREADLAAGLVGLPSAATKEKARKPSASRPSTTKRRSSSRLKGLTPEAEAFLASLPESERTKMTEMLTRGR